MLAQRENLIVRKLPKVRNPARYHKLDTRTARDS
jgi:hypothetical protein